MYRPRLRPFANSFNLAVHHFENAVSNNMPTDREKLVQAAIDDINQKRDLKREEAQQQWIELYGEEEDCKGKDDEMMQDDDEESDVDSSTAESIESEKGDSDESAEEEEDYSEAEEIDSEDEEEEDDDAELSPEQQEALTNRLFELRACQLHEQQTFIARLEAQATARVGPETPDDYVFGSSK